jgi:hypothetical protein
VRRRQSQTEWKGAAAAPLGLQYGGVPLPRERSRNVGGGDGGARAPAREEEEIEATGDFAGDSPIPRRDCAMARPSSTSQTPACGAETGERSSGWSGVGLFVCPISVHTAQFAMLWWLRVL